MADCAISVDDKVGHMGRMALTSEWARNFRLRLEMSILSVVMLSMAPSFNHPSHFYPVHSIVSVYSVKYERGEARDKAQVGARHVLLYSREVTCHRQEGKVV